MGQTVNLRETKSKAATSQETTTKEQAAEILEADRKERIERCQQAIAGALAAARCQLVPKVVISGQQIHSVIDIVASE